MTLEDTDISKVGKQGGRSVCGGGGATAKLESQNPPTHSSTRDQTFSYARQISILQLSYAASQWLGSIYYLAYADVMKSAA